jgi:hypothetical protein
MSEQCSLLQQCTDTEYIQYTQLWVEFTAGSCYTIASVVLKVNIRHTGSEDVALFSPFEGSFLTVAPLKTTRKWEETDLLFLNPGT